MCGGFGVVAEKLVDWAPAKFISHVLGKHPAPKGPDRVNLETGEVLIGEKLWESGIRLQGNQRALIEDATRFIQAGGGWRGGKSYVGAMRIYVDFMWRRGVRGVKDDLWGVLADSYSMAQEEMRHLDRLLSEAGIPHEFRTPEFASWHITFPDSDCEVVTLTASDVTKIASRPYRGIVIAEAAQTVREAWVNAQGRVGETRGWILLEGTFESAKGAWYAQQALAWSKPDAIGVFYSLPSWENLVVYPGGREDPEILSAEKRFSPEEFAEKYAGLPTKRSDLVMRYANDRFHIAHRYPSLRRSYDPDQPVFLWSDPGTSHAYATFAVQFWGNVAWVVDAVYRWDRTAEDIIAECAARPWAPNVELAVMDFAARQRNANGPAVVEQWTNGWRRHVGRSLWVETQPVPLAAGYDIHRRALLNSWPEEDAQRSFNADGTRHVVVDPEGPRLMFAPEAAAPLFGGLVDGREYAGEYNLHRNRKNREGAVVGDDPIPIDDDAIKAISYGLYWHFGVTGLKPRALGVESVQWEMSVA